MQISINPPTFMWFTNDSSIHLTDENPGPIEVDFKEISKENQRLIILGIRNRQIICSEAELNLLDIYNGKQPSHTVPAKDYSNNFEEDESLPVALSEDEMGKLAAQKLNLTLANAKKFINSSDNIRLLRIMLELEKDTRSRESVIKTIGAKLNFLTSQVQSNINKDSTPIIAVLPDPLADQFDIVDTETEQREVEIER